MFVIVIAFLLFLAILWFVFTTGIGMSFQAWQKDQDETLIQNLKEILDSITSPSGSPSPRELHEALRFLVPERGYVILFDTEGRVITGYRKTSSGYQAGTEGNWLHNYLRQHPDDIVRHPLDPQHPEKGSFTFGIIGEGNRSGENKKLVSSLTLTAAVGIGLSFLFSFLFAVIFSTFLSRIANRLVRGIEAIAAGDLLYEIKETGIREIEQIAASANALGKKLDEEQRLRTQWTNDITHDLRTPLGALRAQLEGMRDGVLNPLPSRFDLLLAELRRIEELVNDFNELVALESPEMNLHRENIDVSDFLNELTDMFSLWAEKKKVILETRIPAEGKAGLSLCGDRRLLLRAASNLIDNAVRYANEGGTVELAAVYGGGSFVFSVFNTGTSIPDREIPLVFNRFYRGEFARHTQGSGLGLAITKRIVDLHGGTIRIESGEGKGTKVIIELPGTVPAD